MNHINFDSSWKDALVDALTANNGITVEFIIKASVGMILAILLGFVIFAIYKRFYGGVVYSSSFGFTLVGMTILTCALTLAISSNVVISLGMVGALSIVRYRTAIKDPMDLLYLFWAISIGIIEAAGLYVLALMIMLVMIVLIWLFSRKKKAGVIYIVVVHYEGEEVGGKIMQQFGSQRHQIKSKTIRKNDVELTVELMSRQNNTSFVDHINDLPGVKDVSLIQYNGEYNG